MFETSADLRQSLIRDLEELRSGKINNSSARARASVARTIIDTVSLEIAAEQLGRQFDPVLLNRRAPVPFSKPRRVKRKSAAKLKAVA